MRAARYCIRFKFFQEANHLSHIRKHIFLCSQLFLWKKQSSLLLSADTMSHMKCIRSALPKKDGGLHSILDLSCMNLVLRVSKFKMLTVKSILSQIQPRDWFVTIDLKDAYIHIQIVKRHRKLLRFIFEGNAYNTVFSRLDWHCQTFTKCMNAALASLRLQGIRILNYLDDWLILARSRNQTRRYRDLVLDNLLTLGLRTNEPTKECSAASPASNIFRGRHGFSHDAGTSVSRTCAVITDLFKSVQDRTSSPGRTMSQIVGSDGGSIPCSSAGSAQYATVPVVDQQPECFTSLSSASQNYGDTQRFSCSKTVEKIQVPSERSPAGSMSSSQNYHNRCVDAQFGESGQESSRAGT